ncbi:MAG: 30S ribosome-binding factor RbfA [Verrucomicrobiota bacterium]
MSRRLIRVQELLKREISAVISKEFVFDDVLVTINGIEITPDLKEAKVFVGAVGNPRFQEQAVEKLNAKHGLIQSRVSKRVHLRNTPVLRFILDHAVERGVRILNLIDSLDELPTAPQEESDPEDLSAEQK